MRVIETEHTVCSHPLARDVLDTNNVGDRLDSSDIVCTMRTSVPAALLACSSTSNNTSNIKATKDSNNQGKSRQHGKPEAFSLPSVFSES